MENANILVVEDDADINRLLCTILEGAGYSCRSAFSGSEALLWAEKYDYDLIVLDLMLPGLTGEELIARIRRGKTMPIIVASAKVGVSDRVNVLKLGADDFIPKPFDNAEVLARVGAQRRRSREFSAPRADVLTAGPLVLDRDSHTASLDGEELTLRFYAGAGEPAPVLTASAPSSPPARAAKLPASPPPDRRMPSTMPTWE